MIVGYARVSTDGQTLDAQQAALVDAGCAKVYAEKVSGAKTDRAALAKAIAALTDGDCLIVTKLDRLARSTRGLLNTLATISDKGATFRSLGDSWADTTTPHGRLMLTVLGGLAEFERHLILARTGEGRKRAQQRSVRFGHKLKLTAHQQQEAIARRTGCLVWGVSAWDLKTEGAKQQNLAITNGDEPEIITVDNIEVAQFIHLLLHNQKIRGIIDTITAKVVLILGRFTHERKAVLNSLREELRKRNDLPILFDFEVPARRNIIETVTLLARIARFIIADLTDPSSIPQELQAIIPSVRVPVQPMLLEGSSPYSMFKDFTDYHWVLPVYQYKKPEQLLSTLAEKVIAPAEGKAQALAERRRMRETE